MHTERQRLPDAVRAIDEASPGRGVGDAWRALVAYLQTGRWPDRATPGWFTPLREIGARELSIMALMCQRRTMRARAAATGTLLAWWEGLSFDDAADEARPETAPEGPQAQTTFPPTPAAPGSTRAGPSDAPEWPSSGSGASVGRAPASAEPGRAGSSDAFRELAGRHVRRASARGHDAIGAVATVESALLAVSPWGRGWHPHGTALERAVLDGLDELARVVARSPEVTAIAARLGKLEAAERQGRSVERGGRQTVVGVRVGGELADVLPCELALLADPATEDLFYARLAERRLLSFALVGGLDGEAGAPRRPGPVIACVDTSGSMHGAPELAAKAVVLAVARRVLPKGRSLAVVLFGGHGSFTELTFAPGRADLETLWRFLSARYAGGTDLEGPIRRALELRATPTFRAADLLLVTDGCAPIGGDLVDRLRRLRARDLDVVTVLVGDRGSALEAVSDAVWRVDDPADAGHVLRRY